VDGKAGDVTGFVAELIGRACEHGKRGVVHGDDVFCAEEADGVGGFARAHGEKVADGEHGEVRFVEFADEFHVAEDGGVAGVIDGEAAGHSNDEAGRFASVDANAVIFDGVRMEGVGHGDLECADGLRTAFPHGTDFLLETFFRDVEASFEDGGDFGMVLLGEGEEIAKVVGVGVREKNGVEAVDGFQSRRAEGIAGHPGVDEGDVVGRSGERKGAVAEVGDAIAFCVEHFEFPIFVGVWNRWLR